MRSLGQNKTNSFVTLINEQKYCAGLLVGRGKKVKFRRIFRDKFAEKNSRFHGNFAGILEASFTEKRLVKKGRFRESFPSKFRWKAIGFALI